MPQEPIAGAPANATGATGQTATVPNQDAGATITKIELTQAELDIKLQQESDRRVNQALTTAKAKWEEDFKARIETERADAEKMARMSEEEKARELFAKQQKEFESDKARLRNKEIEVFARDSLSEVSLDPKVFNEFVISHDEESTKAKITKFKTAFDEAVKAEVEKRFKEVGQPAHKGAQQQPNSAPSKGTVLDTLKALRSI